MAPPSVCFLCKLGNLAEHLDRTLGRGELVEELAVVLESLHGMREEPREPPRILRLGLRHVADAQLEVLAVRVDRADHDLVAEHEFEIDLVGGHFHLAVATGYAGEDKHAVLAESLETV